MPEREFMSPSSPTLEALQNRSRDLRRARPPDITILRHENRVPLRPERLAKRESRIGLRSIFSKSRPGKDDKIVEEPSSIKDPSRHMGKRSSLADLGSWPQRLNPSRSEISLSSSPQASLKSPTSIASSSSSRLRQNSNGVNQSKLRPQASPKTRGSITPFDPPPLFKMYPQAIKHATLPTCLTPIEALARLNDSKTSLTQDDFSQSNLTLSQVEASGLGSKFDGDKKKKSKAPEWTSKIYALVTSGYLLQYAAEGPFNRLPEKILHLTRDSAAYASDLIPGRHWVVRVASSTDADGNPSSDTKSFRSKLALRGAEKRQVSNMLLVFESPETMDTWLAILRREIESLGGKKKLSETGKPETEEDTAMPKAPTSQRTLVVRDPARFSRIVSQDFSWNQENALADPTEESDAAEPPVERVSESTVDDGSSLVSLEGQRLDSLRDRDSGSGSGSSGCSGNRLSFVSSGQRTIISSAESSPTTSPIRESFSSHGHEYLQKALPPTPEVRPRPNAAAIVNRRQSMQTMIPGFDPRLDAAGRPTSILPSTLTSVHESKHQFVPNFSVPHTVGRRYSAMNLSAVASRTDQPQLDRDGPIKPPRRSPPTKLAISRPLSIVLDQPSPRSPYSPTVSTNKGPTVQAPDSPSMFAAPWTGNTPNPKPQAKKETPRSQIPKRITEEAQLRSTTPDMGSNIRNNIRSSRQGSARPHPETDKSFAVRPARSQTLEPIEAPEQIRRASSSLEMRRTSTTAAFGHQSIKHAIILSEGSTRPNRHSLIYPKQSSLPSIEEPAYTLAPPLTCSPKRSAPSLKASQPEEASKQFLTVDTSPKSLATRRSMPHLAEGPPPAPPPTCALPPLPRKRSTNIPRSIKA